MTTLAEKIAFLGSPAAYGGSTEKVEARETHMSWVFLADDHVYKLKKPVKYAFLDFSTLARREFFCNEELRLNRRLAPDTYLGVTALRRTASGALTTGPKGRVVDWLVRMNRLPETEMVDNLIRTGRLDKADVVGIGHLLASFYRECEPQIADGNAFPDNLAEQQEGNRALLLRGEFGVSQLAAGPLEMVKTGLSRLAPAITARIREGRIVEGHGDLRPEHVCLTTPPQIIDCLEFNRSLRIVDPYDEAGYLGLECEAAGAAWVRPLLLDTLAADLGGRPAPQLIALYGAARMLLRARLCVAHFLEKPVRHPEKWQPLARRYLEIATRLCGEFAAAADGEAIAPGGGDQSAGERRPSAD